MEKIKILTYRDEKNGMYRYSVWRRGLPIRWGEFETEEELNEELTTLQKRYKGFGFNVIISGNYVYSFNPFFEEEPPTIESLKADIRSSFIRLISKIGVEDAVEYLDSLVHETWDAVREVEKATEYTKTSLVVEILSDRRGYDC